MFDDAADDPVGKPQAFAQRVWHRRRRSSIERLLRTRLVAAPIENEFASTVGKRAHLQTSVGTAKERVVLRDIDWTLVRDGDRPGQDVLDTRDPCFDLDITGHASVWLHGGQFIARRIPEVETPAAGKCKDRFRDDTARVAHPHLRGFQRFNLDHGQRRLRRLARIGLQPEVDIAAHRASIRGTEVGHRKPESGGVEGFGRRCRRGRQFDEGDSVDDRDASWNCGASLCRPQ